MEKVKGFFPLLHGKKKPSEQKWQKGDTMNVSIGQGDLVSTLLQLSVAYNVLATQGLLVKPFIVKQKPDNHPTRPIVLDSLTDRIKREHFKTIQEGLRLVIEGNQGTARWYKIPSLSYAGKTGTAQVVSFSVENLSGQCKKFPKEIQTSWVVFEFCPHKTT